MAGHRKRLLENFFSLSILQVANYVLPLIAVPYLVRVLGPEKFGLVAFAQAFAQYFMIFTDYGFNFSATRDISIHRTDPQKISKICSSVITAKIIFTVVSFVVYGLIVLCFDKFRLDWELYLAAFVAVIGNVLFFQWYFQGIEKMKYITVINVFTRLLFVVMIIFFVRSENDYVLSAGFYSAGYFIAGLISAFVVFYKYRLTYALPKISEVKETIIGGYHVFVANLAASLYTTSNVFILGLLTNNTLVGYYSAGEKIVKAVQAMFWPVSQTIFPHMSYLANNSRREALCFIRKVTIVSGALTFAASLALLWFAPQIVRIALGHKYLPAILVLQILSFLPFICNLGNIFGTQIMINFGLSRNFAWVLGIAGLINVVSALVLVPFFKQNGLAVSVMLTETLITIALFAIIESRRISPRSKWIKWSEPVNN